MFDGTQHVLVVGAHPDDEVLGVGGTIARHTASGDEVVVLIVTEGATAQYDDESMEAEKREAVKACASVLGVSEVRFGELPDMRLDEVAHVDLNACIEAAIDEVNPDVVYTHSRREVNRDHVAVHDSTLVATRPGSGVQRTFSYETPSSTDWMPRTAGFEPTVFVDIADYLETKLRAFESYEMETRPFPHPRSTETLRALATVRGACANMAAAEAFDVLRVQY